MKFGISFTATQYNQAGALVHVYTDGSIHLNHGGTEMGQGLYVKVAQVVADEFQVDIDKVRITATTTGKVPNTSATAASSGADLNGKAAPDAAQHDQGAPDRLRGRELGVPREQVVFLPRRRVRIGNQDNPLRRSGPHRLHGARPALLHRLLQDAGNPLGPGQPAAASRSIYFAYGAAASEVTVDTLTGEYRVDRVDILHDVGSSLNPALDLGQVEGGFIQGMGWLTTEELWWDDAGPSAHPRAPAPTRSPPAATDPKIFNVHLLENSPNRKDTIYRSKAVGEPPLMLGMSVLHAISDAVASVADLQAVPPHRSSRHTREGAGR